MKTLTASSSLPRVTHVSPGALGYWHLLSLDAPTVAAVWTMFVARSVRVELPWGVPAAMFVAVWAIYAADRLLDVRRQKNLEARHRFHGRHRRAFVIVLVVACCGLVFLILGFSGAMLRLYAGLGGLLAIWLGIVHLLPRVNVRPIPKELAVGVFFSAAVFIPAWAFMPAGGLLLATLVTANLCSLNCLFIYAWEHSAHGEAHASTRLGLARLREIAVGSILLPLALLVVAPAQAPIMIAASLAAGLLIALDRVRRRLEQTTLRAAADAALLTPLLVLPFLR